MSINPEKLLWELSRLEEESGEPIPADSTLRDFQKGRLAAQEAAQVERLLAHSHRARMRLVELGGVKPEAPSQELRSRVLASLPARPQSRLSWQRAAWAAAAMVLMILMAQQFWSAGPSPAFVPDYEIQVFGAAAVRNPDQEMPQEGALPEYGIQPDTRVRIELRARRGSTSAAGYGLYRLQEGQLQRLSQGVNLNTFRGAARFEALGSALAPQPGQWQLFALVAAKQSLPLSLPLQSGESPQAKLKEASGGQVFALQLELLPDGAVENQKGKEEEQ